MKRAAIYARISKDDAGEALGVARQIQDCRALAEAKGWEIIDPPYADNDTSAYRAKPRKSYDRLLADIEAGRVDALVVWDIDRLTRRPAELERIIELADRVGLALASVGGEIDLSTPQGRLTARIKGAVARSEVEQSSRRIRRALQARAEQGLLHGRVAYGWDRVGKTDVLNPEQAAVIQQAARALLAGDSLRSIAKDLNERGVPSPTGKAWIASTVRHVIARPRNAGLRVHQGQIVGMSDWEPALEEGMFRRVEALLAANPVPSNREPVNLLTNLARCGVCNAPVRTLVAYRKRYQARAYQCRSGFCIRRRATDVDALVEAVVIKRLSQPDALAAIAQSEGDEMAKVHDAMAEIRARLDLVADQFAEGKIDGQQLARITAKLRPQLEESEDRLRRLTAHPDLVDLAVPDIAERWGSLSLDRKRAVIRALLDIRIMPMGRGRFDPRSVVITAKGSSDH